MTYRSAWVGFPSPVLTSSRLTILVAFLPYGFGCVFASILNGRLMDWNFRRVARLNNIPIDKKRGMDLCDFPIERARLQICFPLLYLGIVTILIYGWVLEINAHVAVPLVLLFFVGLFVTGAFNVMSTMRKHTGTSRQCYANRL